MNIKNPRDFWASTVLTGIGLAFTMGATSYELGSSSEPGPGYFPFGLGILLIGLGLLGALKALVSESKDGGAYGAIALRPMLLFVAAIATFGFLLPRLGLWLALPILVLMVTAAGTRPGEAFLWKGALMTAAVLTVGSWLAFAKGLDLMIPLRPAILVMGA